MDRVTKIFISSQAVFADGSFLGVSGCSSLSSVAEYFSVPVFVLAPSYNFTPLMAFDQRTMCPHVSPFKVFPEAVGKNGLEVLMNVYDVVDSKKVTMIVSENDVYSPDYIYRVFNEYYLDHDYGYDLD